MKRKLIVLFLALVFISTLTSCGVEPAPKIKDGRFNFSITYEQWGETKTISGVFVCEYAGRSWTLEGGNFTRDWSGYVEGVENLDETYYASVSLYTADDGGEVLLDLALSPAHLMGEPHLADAVMEPGIFVVYSSEDNLSSEQISDDEEIESLYGVKIIDYHYDAPIENTFKP
jgi:hypothetical protein